MKFKGVESNSTVREIGSLFRKIDQSDWYINVKLMPNHKKQYFGISQTPVLARRRIINPANQVKPAGFQSSVLIKSASLWEVSNIKSCPIAPVSKQGDSQQLCFTFQHKGTTYYLPQLELARVLFFHHAYITRLSLIDQGLVQDFDVQRMNGLDKALINILPVCSLPLYVRGDYALRRLLAWILLDPDARRSFESISYYQFQNGYDTEKYRAWNFQFDPPFLEGVELTLRGHYDQELKAFFVYEIYGVSNLTCNCPSHVEFFDPRYQTQQSGGGSTTKPSASPMLEFEIDDEQDPDTDNSEIIIEASTVSFEFTNPFETTRVGKGGRASGGVAQGEDQSIPSTNTGVEVSTNESSIHGTLPSADYDGLDDRSEDTHLYADKFEAFAAMVEHLVAMPNCKQIRYELRKLPPIEGYSKHLLSDGNPRCLAFYLIKMSNTVYALLEVDTSDNKNRLSTLLLKQQDQNPNWDRRIAEIEILLVKRSLVWPTPYLKKVVGKNYKPIRHQMTTATVKSSLEQESVQRWAERVYAEMNG
jgi:hypothetical protein